MEDDSNNERKDCLPVSLIGCADAERLSGERRARGGGAGPAAGRPEQSGIGHLRTASPKQFSFIYQT